MIPITGWRALTWIKTSSIFTRGTSREGMETAPIMPAPRDKEFPKLADFPSKQAGQLSKDTARQERPPESAHANYCHMSFP